jgi:hypothetical protein
MGVEARTARVDAELSEPLAQPVLQVMAFVDAVLEHQRRGFPEEQLPRARSIPEPPVVKTAHYFLQLVGPGIGGHRRPDDRAGRCARKAAEPVRAFLQYADRAHQRDPLDTTAFQNKVGRTSHPLSLPWSR